MRLDKLQNDSKVILTRVKVPFARCALEIADRLGKDEACYQRIYQSAGKSF